MAISSYSELQTAVANWVERDDLTARIPEFIALAEAEMGRRLKSRQRTSTSTATLSDVRSAVPADFAGAISFKIDGGNPLTFVRAQEMARMKDDNSAGGEPAFYAVVGSQFEFHPAPDSTYTAELVYRADLTPLSDSETSNWVLASHPDAYLYGAAKHAGSYLRDAEMLNAAEALFSTALEQINTDDITQSAGDARALRRKPF